MSAELSNVAFWPIATCSSADADGRFRGKADMIWRTKPAGSVENDPNRSGATQDFRTAN